MPPLPSLDPPESDFSENREESQIAETLCTNGTTWEMHLMHHLHQEHASQHVRTLESQPRSIVIKFTCKDTLATWISGLPVEYLEL